MHDVSRILVHSQVTVREALGRLDETGKGILLLVDADGRLLRTVTDGDLRRLILGGGSLDGVLGALAPKTPVSTDAPADAMAALAAMDRNRVDHLPMIDADGRPVGLYLRRDVDSPVLLSTPHLSDFERQFVEEAFKTNWIAPLGPNVDAFEKEIAEYAGVGHAAAVSSGTAAIHLALRLLGVSRGDSVFCSTLTFVASANPILYQGAVPTFIDSEPETWNMSPQALGAALEAASMAGALPKAVIVVNIYGQSADLDRIRALCDHYQVPVVEDAAESLGATYKSRQSGTSGRLGIYSFNGNKIITTSGGGMLVSDDGDLIGRARFLSTQAREPAPHYEHSVVGYNYRMSNVLAGIGRGQLKVLESRVAARRAVFERYREALADVDAIHWMPEAAFGRSTRWLSAFVVDRQVCVVTPAQILRRLAGERIEARPVWKPMHQQPLFLGSPYFSHEPGRSVTDALFRDGICLPSGSNMTGEQQGRVIDALRRCFAYPAIA